MCPDCCESCTLNRGNQAPFANSGGPYLSPSGNIIPFNGTGSYDPDGRITSYMWNFGDGATSTQLSPSHTYLLSLGSTGMATTYPVTLTVTDNNGVVATNTTSVTIGSASPLPCVAGPDGGGCTGQTIVNGSASHLVSQSVPTSMIAGRSYDVSVTMSNTGNTVWTAAGSYRLGSQNAVDNNTWGVRRVAVPSSVAPNTNTTLHFIVTAPSTPGTYNFQWRMVQDGAGWFGDFTPNTSINVAPAPSEAEATGNVWMARLDPSNRTGEPGDDLFSRNYNWGVPLVSLPGRAGLDLGLGLTFNSLVWTRWGSTNITYDADNGFPGPGSRLGFPTIQGPFQDDQAGKPAFLMITSAGGHIELRQGSQANIYEATDSSYLQITAGSNLLVRAADGTQMTYVFINNEYKCVEEKDRNGNYLSMNYDNLGHLLTILDTLGRLLTFNYDQNTNLLQSITQVWTVNGQPLTHTWASFVYGDLPIQTNFPGLTVIGPQNGQSIPVLQKVTFSDNSAYGFGYNPYGQMKFILHEAADGQVLTALLHRTNTEGNPPFVDCPRVTRRTLQVRNWFNSFSDSAITDYSTDSATGAQMATLPDDKVYKEYYGSGWQKGLVNRTENYAAGESSPRKWTTTEWRQDDTGVDFKTNPRPIESNIYDSDNNRRRTTIDYGAFGLPSDVREYDSLGTTVLRRTHTDYVTDNAYLDRRILGLPQVQYLYGLDEHGIEQLYSKVDYQYDAAGEFLVSQGAPVQHDELNYGIDLVQGRGNVTSMRRYNVNSPTDVSQATVSRMAYNTTGSVIFTRDPLGHQASVDYADSFSDGVARNTLAYPGMVTDADGFQSFAQYNYDFGATTRKQTPPPQGSTTGPIQTIAYDAIGRPLQATTQFNGNTDYSHTRWVYPTSGLQVNTFTTINDGAGEAYSTQVFDGEGRVRANASDLPNSTGGYSAQYFVYDLMGRLVQQSNPTETNANASTWQPTGDDDPNNGGNGWVYTQQAYDWKGRPTITTNQDGTTKEASYGGCGCAGGAVVTLTDEGTLDAGATKKRQQKVYSDVLGRTVKTEVLNWDGTGPNGTGGSVYSTTVNNYNARDQVSMVRQFQGTAPTDPNDLSCPSGTCQQTTLTYDGYGRVKTKHEPEQDATTATTYSYNVDDTVKIVTDARGASQTLSYNNRHLVTGISYSAPSGITPTAPVFYAYDAAGNRTSMNDGFGSKTYSYNQLSRLMSETRTFTDVGTFTLSYDYNLAGELKKITDSTNMTINYGFDSTGRLSGVTGSDNLVGGVSNYSSGFQYRAWGGLKQVSIGGSHTTSVAYNARLQVTNFNIGGGVANQNYDYHNDGRLSFVHNTTDINFDSSFGFDHAGRLTVAATGGAARHDTGPVPMYETFQYNEWGNTTNRVSESWLNDFYDSASYTNGRRTGWTYDVDGRVATIDTRTYTHDVAGKIRSFSGQRWAAPSGVYVPTSTTGDFDGDGQKVRETSDASGSAITTYYLRSSVLRGEIVEELNSSGQKQFGYVYTPVGGLIARQVPAQNYVMLKQSSPTGASQYEFFKSDTVSGQDIRQEFDPLGANVRLNPGPVGHGGGAGDIPSGGGGPSDSHFGDLANPAAGCVRLLDGVPTPCDWINRMANGGALQLRDGNTRYDIQLLGGSTLWVDAWVEYFKAGRGFLGNDDNGQEMYDAGTTGIRNVGYFITIPSGAAGLGTGVPPQNAGTPVSREDKEAVKSRIEAMLKIEKCQNFVNKLLEEVQRQTGRGHIDVLSAYDQISFVWDHTGTAGGYANNDNGVKWVQISNSFRNEKFISTDRTAAVNRITADNFFAETMHLVNTSGQYYSDPDYANAVNAIRVQQGLEKPRTFINGTKAQIDEASVYWHIKLVEKCDPPHGTN